LAIFLDVELQLTVGLYGLHLHMLVFARYEVVL
jgi:hypothetical protein